MKIMKVLIEEMESAAENQRLDNLYRDQVDENLFEDECDYEKDARALYYYPEEAEFGFVDYITRHNPDRSVFESQNAAVFVAWVDANRAIVSSLEELVDNLKEEAEHNEA